MYIIRIKSGLGNQMFQYALYKKLEKYNSKLDIYTSYEMNPNQHNGYELENVFKLQPNIANREEINRLSDNNNSLLSRIRRKYWKIKKTHINEKTEFKYDENIFKNKNVYLDGYWQSIEYFKDIEVELRNDFKFKYELDSKNKEILDKIKNSNSVSIHIRRGDYISERYINVFGNIATNEYYLKAIEIINKKVDNPTFYIFSNDIEWVKENLKIDGIVEYIDINSGRDSYKDMQLMSNCKHNIIANSSFSWWGAWLNNNKNKLIIAPKKWINRVDINSDEIELFYKNWILL